MAEAVQNIQFELVSPERKLVSEPIYHAVLPAEEGQMGVGSGHSSYVVSLAPGVVELYADENDSDKRRIFIAGGFADITSKNCTVLAEQAVNVADLDEADLAQQLKDLNEDLGMTDEEADKRRVSQKITLVEAKLQALRS
ncbi:ATP synthase F1 subunit epsilon [Alphaproteobacteria bacterium]|nr:ATP synthase F1 subunit epsilon [Alphaproteobacteria bacterium]